MVFAVFPGQRLRAGTIGKFHILMGCPDDTDEQEREDRLQEKTITK